MGACLSGSKTDDVSVSTDNNKSSTSNDVPANNSGSGGAPAAKSLDESILSEDDEPVREEPIEDFYELGKEIGRGGFSVVVEALEKKTGDKCAIKCIKKTMVEGDDIKLLRREIKIMKKVSHPNILKLYEVFEDEDEFFLVMEL